MKPHKLWTGATNNKGYGHLWVIDDGKPKWSKKKRGKKKYWLAHRRAYFEEYGAIPKGMQVRHKCGIKLCIEPSHLLIGNQSDNEKDKIVHGTARYYAQYGKRGYHGRLLPLEER